jgi:ABC-type nickel/cobalt efflux system permease component RcnA
VYYLIAKALLSGAIVATVSEVARRHPGWGGLIASLPLVSLLGMIWLWRDTHDPARMAAHAEATFWFVLPSLPMFLLVPRMLRLGYAFWLALALGCILTASLYALMVHFGPRWGLRL